MRQLEQLNLDIQNPETIENKMYNLLLNMKYTDETAKKIIMKIQDYTNQDYNFDMYWDYRDEVDEKIIGDFISDNKCKYDTLEEAKQDLRQYLDEKYCMYENDWIYQDELAKELNTIDNVDGGEVVEAIRDELGLLYLDYDMLDICKGRYRIAIDTTLYHDTLTSCFYDGKYEDWKDDIKNFKDKSILQRLCKLEGFDLEDILKYGIVDTDTEEYKKYTKIKGENKFFNDLYVELVNCMGYGEDLRFLTSMDIDERLLYACVKNQKYDLYNTSYFGFYDHVNGSGSTFDGEVYKHCEVDNSELNFRLYSRVNYFESCYGFSNNAFGL